MDARAELNDRIPLVVDLDGTLSNVNPFHEAVLQFILRKPIPALQTLLRLKAGRAAFNFALAAQVNPDCDNLSINPDVLDTITQARREGRKVYLATAADKRFAEAVASSIGMFDGVFAAEHGISLKGKAKADRLVAAFGVSGFDYCGSAAAHIPIWREARHALISAAPSQLVKRLSLELPNLVVLSPREFSAKAAFFLTRPHQWLKNTLLFVPAIAAHQFDAGTLSLLLTAFISFSLVASSAYVFNDMLDLQHDRAHSEKRHRALAAGALSLSNCLALFFLLATSAIISALTLNWGFVLCLVGYYSLSISYSLYLKRKLMIDVVALAALYGIRVIAGGVATSIVPSDWMIAFCFFMFLSLALVKRATEMRASPATEFGNIPGRGYRRNDLPVISAMMIGSGLVGILVLGLYLNSPEVKLLYHRPFILWGICAILTYWMGRIFVLTERGEMRQDPVIFAATDWISQLAAGLIAAIFLVAI
jgi:4-hydroxybenzoate polyprenyltransferase